MSSGFTVCQWLAVNRLEVVRSLINNEVINIVQYLKQKKTILGDYIGHGVLK